MAVDAAFAEGAVGQPDQRLEPLRRHLLSVRGARSAQEPTELEGKKGVLRRSAIHTYGEGLHSFVDRSDYTGTFLPGYADVEHVTHRYAPRTARR